MSRTLTCVALIAAGLSFGCSEEDNMTSDALNPFADIERVLADPPATGMFVTFVTPASPADEAGLVAGDTVVAVGEVEGPTLQSFHQALQPGGADDTSRLLRLRRPDGSAAEIGITLPFRGYSACPVVAGKPAWEDLPDTDYVPDFSGLADGTEIWLRNSLGEDRAGFERLIVRRQGEFIEVDTLFRLGGEHEGETWDYRTHSVARHRLDRTLSLVKTTFSEGSPGEEKLQGACELGEDGVWRGVRGTPDGGEEPVEHRPVSLHTLGSLYEAFDATEARRLARRLELHYTPKHASWLNIAENEIGVLSQQCLDQRIEDPDELRREVDAWERERNEKGVEVNWKFTVEMARVKLRMVYPHISSQSDRQRTSPMVLGSTGGTHEGRGTRSHGRLRAGRRRRVRRPRLHSRLRSGRCPFRDG